MTYVITQPCISVKDASCVEVCPVDCIHTDDAAEQYFIDPEECIDCGACQSECPVTAIFPDNEVPDAETPFVGINALVVSGIPAVNDAVEQHLQRAATGGR